MKQLLIRGAAGSASLVLAERQLHSSIFVPSLTLQKHPCQQICQANTLQLLSANACMNSHHTTAAETVDCSSCACVVMLLPFTPNSLTQSLCLTPASTYNPISIQAMTAAARPSPLAASSHVCLGGHPAKVPSHPQTTQTLLLLHHPATSKQQQEAAAPSCLPAHFQKALQGVCWVVLTPPTLLHKAASRWRQQQLLPHPATTVEGGASDLASRSSR